MAPRAKLNINLLSNGNENKITAVDSTTRSPVPNGGLSSLAPPV
jgi:hypothetical protein